MARETAASEARTLGRAGPPWLPGREPGGNGAARDEPLLAHAVGGDRGPGPAGGPGRGQSARAILCGSAG